MNELQEIHERNKRVELDKAWETSWTRRLIIAAITYGVAYLFMWNVRLPDPAISACIPTGGYLLSTLSLSFVRRWWMKWRSAASKQDQLSTQQPTITKTELDNAETNQEGWIK